MTVIQFRQREFKPVYRPDPRNGEVYACEGFACVHEKNGVITEAPAGFIVVHMSRSGDSAGIQHGFATMEDAQTAAYQEAVRRNAVYLP